MSVPASPINSRSGDHRPPEVAPPSPSFPRSATAGAPSAHTPASMAAASPKGASTSSSSSPSSSAAVTASNTMVAELLRQQGNLAVSEGSYDAAIDCYTRALAVDPRNTKLYSNRSVANLRADNTAAALEDAKMAVKLDGTWWRGYQRLGAAYERLSNTAEAKAAYAQGIATVSTNDRDQLRQALQRVEAMEKTAAAAAAAAAAPAAQPQAQAAATQATQATTPSTTTTITDSPSATITGDGGGGGSSSNMDTRPDTDNPTKGTPQLRSNNELAARLQDLQAKMTSAMECISELVPQSPAKRAAVGREWDARPASVAKTGATTAGSAPASPTAAATRTTPEGEIGIAAYWSTHLRKADPSLRLKPDAAPFASIPYPLEDTIITHLTGTAEMVLHNPTVWAALPAKTRERFPRGLRLQGPPGTEAMQALLVRELCKETAATYVEVTPRAVKEAAATAADAMRGLFRLLDAQA